MYWILYHITLIRNILCLRSTRLDHRTGPPGKRKNIRLFDENRLTTWFDIFLPTFDLTRPEVANMVSDSAAFWIREYNIDGFRHDAAKHVPEIYWRTLTKKLNQQVVIPQRGRFTR